MRLPDEPRAVAEARRAVSSFGEELTPAKLEDLRLLTTEVVTNAIRHAGGWVDLHIDALPGCVRVEVIDPGPGFAPGPPDPPSTDSIDGRGLYLVDQIADRWGVERGRRTRVWFEIGVG